MYGMYLHICIYIVYVCTHSYTYIIHSHQPHWVNGVVLNCTGYFGLSRQGHFQPRCFSAPFQLALSQNEEHNQQPYALVYIKAMKWHEHSKCWAPWEILRTSETKWFNVKRSNERDSAGIFRMKSLFEFCCTIGWSQTASVMRLSDAAVLRAMFAKGCQCESDFGRWWPYIYLGEIHFNHWSRSQFGFGWPIESWWKLAEAIPATRSVDNSCSMVGIPSVAGTIQQLGGCVFQP